MNSQMNRSGPTDSRIAFFRPFDSFYLSPTAEIYQTVIEAIPGVFTVALDRPGETLPAPYAADLVVFTPMVFLGQSRDAFEKSVNHLRRNYYIPFFSQVTYERCERYYQTFLAFLASSRTSLFLLIEYDLHALVQDEFLWRISRRDADFLMLTGAELYDPDLHHRSTRGNADSTEDVNFEHFRLGYAFIEEKKHRVVSLPQVMATEEFCTKAHIAYGKRGRRISVRGTSYVARRRAVTEVVRRYPWEYAAHGLDQGFLRIVNRMPNAWLRQQLLRRSFRRSIAASRISFTCGSTAGYFVRKFLEIPAFGACLCTFNYKFLENAGFRPDVHYLPVKTVEDISAYVDRLQSEEFLRHVIDCTANGWSLILKTHSAYARHSQLMETFERIIAGNFRGSYWGGGQYSYR